MKQVHDQLQLPLLLSFQLQKLDEKIGVYNLLLIRTLVTLFLMMLLSLLLLPVNKHFHRTNIVSFFSLSMESGRGLNGIISGFGGLILNH